MRLKLPISLISIMLFSIAAAGQTAEVKKFANDADVPRMSVEEAKKAFDEGKVVFVDARAADAYKLEHIKGAIIIEGADEARFDKLPKGKNIVVYCS